jgi:hypothetical protein
MSTVPGFRIDVDIHGLLMDNRSQGPKAAEAKNLILAALVPTSWEQAREEQQKC